MNRKWYQKSPGRDAAYLFERDESDEVEGNLPESNQFVDLGQ